jgi:hypothetical protein
VKSPEAAITSLLVRLKARSDGHEAALLLLRSITE